MKKSLIFDLDGTLWEVVESTLDKAGIIWYIVKIIALVLLVVLFFNKKLLSKIGLSLNKR